MILKALDLLRELGYGVISLIYNFIDTIYTVISKINELDIIGTMAENKIFSNFYNSVVVISLTIFGLFVTWQFAKKIIEPDENPPISMIVQEVFKCGALLLLSTFLFVQVSTFSIKLTGYVGTIFTKGESTKLGTELLSNYIDYSDGYKESDDFQKEDYKKLLQNGKFEKEQKYNDKYVLVGHLLRADEKDYKYKIEWIVAILCGGFFLYALIFSSIMLARRQIEFLFLFIISPVIYATSVCNKQRRGALIEQLTSLTLQSAVVVLIINIVALLAVEIDKTTLFNDGFQDMLGKTLLYLGCATFLLTGSGIVNRFIGSNVSANSGREQLMSLMGFGKLASAGTKMGLGAVVGSTLFGFGASAKGANYIAEKTGIAGRVGRASNNLLQSVGNSISDFGGKFGSAILPDGSTMSSSNPIERAVQNVGNRVREHGKSISASAERRNTKNEGLGLNSKLSHGTSAMMGRGLNMMNPLNKITMPKHTGKNPYR